MRTLVLGAVLLAALPARAQDDPDCTDCTVDLDVDECALPGADCLPETDVSDDQLEAAELAAGIDDLTYEAPAPGVAVSDQPVSNGGCSTTGSAPASLLLLMVVGALVLRRRPAVALGVLVCLLGCVAGSPGWDGALADGPPADAAGQYLDVQSSSGEWGFALLRAPGDGARAIHRSTAGGCERLSADTGELVGWAAGQPLDGTAALTELVAPDGCSAIYETDPDAIQLWLDQGYTAGAELGWVWPPGWGSDAPVDEVEVAKQSVPTACKLGPHPNLFLFYTGIDHDHDLGLLKGCPGEVVLGEKHMDGPHGEFQFTNAHAAGGRTALVFGDNGRQFLSMLLRSNGVERTAAFIRDRLKRGYDYVVIDEVTTDPRWADGTTANHRFRQLLGRIPGRKLIAYISLDLTKYPGGGAAMHDRRYLLRALKLRGRALALEDYLHTGEVMAGYAPSVFRTASDRLVAAVHGMRGAPGVSRRAIITLGLSMHTAYPQYNYLDSPSHDLAAITRQVNAIRHGSGRLRVERGLGFYFIGGGDITPSGHTYDRDDVVARIHRAMLAF
jgi:uncharacterized protein (TIGR03382 family)